APRPACRGRTCRPSCRRSGVRPRRCEPACVIPSLGGFRQIFHHPCSLAMRIMKGARMDERIERARLLYEGAIFGEDYAGLSTAERELDAVEADLALARGRITHGRYLERQEEDSGELALFERAAELYRALGDVRGEAEALFWIGCFHQVVHRD